MPCHDPSAEWPNCVNVGYSRKSDDRQGYGTGTVYYGEEYPYESFDYDDVSIPHPFDAIGFNTSPQSALKDGT